MSDLYKARFEKYVSPEPTSGCWLWTGAAQKNGRALFSIERITVVAARVSWSIHKSHIESIPLNVPGWDRDGWHSYKKRNPAANVFYRSYSRLVLHTCDNPNCVNPDHLYIGTNKQNAIDRCARHPYFVKLRSKKYKKDIDAV
jgi:hypothetical protein